MGAVVVVVVGPGANVCRDSVTTEVFVVGGGALTWSWEPWSCVAPTGISVLMKTRDTLGDSTPFCVVADGPTPHRPLTLLGVNEMMCLCRTLDDAVSKLTDR